MVDQTQAPVLSAADHTFFQENGYLVIDDVVPQEVCEAAKADIMAYLGLDADAPLADHYDKVLPDDRGGKLRHLEQDFAAIIAPGLQTAFVDRQQIHLKGHTIFHKQAEREIWVCGPGAYIVLKALAFTNRGENKDAYDLYYVLKYYGDDIEDIIPAFHMIQTTPDAQLAISVLERDFTDHQQIGPRRVAMFLTGGVDMKIQQDVVGYISMFLEKIKIEK